MATTLQKWGNSLGIRLPKAVAEQVNLSTGSEVEFDTTGGVLTIRPVKRRRPKLADLLAKVKPRHRHGELHNDQPRGGELI